MGDEDIDPNMTIEQNAALIEPGMEFATEDFRAIGFKEWRRVLETHLRHAWQRARGRRN